MNWRRSERKRSRLIQRGTTRDFSEETKCPGRDSNRLPAWYKSPSPLYRTLCWYTWILRALRKLQLNWITFVWAVTYFCTPVVCITGSRQRWARVLLRPKVQVSWVQSAILVIYHQMLEWLWMVIWRYRSNSPECLMDTIKPVFGTPWIPLQQAVRSMLLRSTVSY